VAYTLMTDFIDAWEAAMIETGLEPDRFRRVVTFSSCLPADVWE